MENELRELEEKYNKLEQKVLQLEFRQELMMSDTNTNRVLLDYNITRKQYEKIMDIMDEMRDKLEKGSQGISHAEFENKIESLINRPEVDYHNRPEVDYHFCEYIAKAFMEDGRWEEVFPTLYGDMPKYKYLKEDK